MIGEQEGQTNTNRDPQFMREREIKQNREGLKLGKVMLWVGEDGSGKTRLLEEIRDSFTLEGRNTQILPASMLDNHKSLDEWLEYVDNQKTLAKEDRSAVLVDSVDYLWRRSEDSGIRWKRRELLRKIVDSDLDVVMTTHMEDRKAAEVDEVEKIMVKNTLNKSRVQSQELVPVYDQEILVGRYIEVGMLPEVARQMTQEVIWRHPALISNYVAKNIDSIKDYLNKTAGVNPERLKDVVKGVMNKLTAQRLIDVSSWKK